MREKNKDEYTKFQIPIETTSTVLQFYKGGQSILCSTIEAGFFRIYSGGRGT
jgi:hypothetical protein